MIGFFPTPASIVFTSWRCKRCHKVNRPSTLICSCAPPEPSEDQIGHGYTKPPESWGRAN